MTEEEERFERETAGVDDSVAEPVGEVIPPGGDVEDGVPLDKFFTDEIVAVVFAVPGNLMARKTGEDYWQISEDELALLGKGCGPGVRYLLNKYLNGADSPTSVMLAALGVVYGPRLMTRIADMKRERDLRGMRPNSTKDARSSSGSGEPENPPKPGEWQGAVGDV